MFWRQCVDKIIDEVVLECLTILEQMVDAPESRDSASSSFSPRREALISQMLSLGDLFTDFSAMSNTVFSKDEVQKRILKVLGRGTRHSVLSIQMTCKCLVKWLYTVFACVRASVRPCCNLMAHFVSISHFLPANRYNCIVYNV